MDDSSSGFGEESPILFKHPKTFCEVGTSERNLNLDDLYNELMLHFKKYKSLTKKELTYYLVEMDKIKPADPKNRWLAKKVRGLIKYILKKKVDFQSAIVRGEIVVYEKSNSKETPPFINMSQAPISPSASESEVNIPSNLLTNNDFVSMDVLDDQNVVKKEADIHSCSQDLFSSNTAEILHNYGQENYQFLKNLTQNSISNEVSQSTPTDQVYQVHEKLEANYKSLISLVPAVKQDIIKCDEKNPDVMMKSQDNTEINIFDQFSEDCQQLKDTFRSELEETDKWVSEIISNLMKLDIRNKRKVKKETTNNISLNMSFTSTSSTELKPYYSEENYKIIKETCLQFKQNVARRKGLPFLTRF